MAVTQSLDYLIARTGTLIQRLGHARMHLLIAKQRRDAMYKAQEDYAVIKSAVEELQGQVKSIVDSVTDDIGEMNFQHQVMVTPQMFVETVWFILMGVSGTIIADTKGGEPTTLPIFTVFELGDTVELRKSAHASNNRFYEVQGILVDGTSMSVSPGHPQPLAGDPYLEVVLYERPVP